MKEIGNRAFIISDVHLGVYRNKDEWIKIAEEYFDEFFFPLVRREKKPGDVLIIAGDMIEFQQSMHHRISAMVHNLFRKFSETFDHVIFSLGNHDIYNRKTHIVNDDGSYTEADLIHPFHFLNWIPNVSLVERSELFLIGGKKVCVMGYYSDSGVLTQHIRQDNSDYLICHADIVGMQFNSKVVIEEGLRLSELKKYKQVYSGHIHYRQMRGNVNMIGCAFSHTRSDNDNHKQLFIIDFENDAELAFDNDVSPKYKQFDFAALLDMTVEQVRNEFRNNFIDLIIVGKWNVDYPFVRFEELFGEYYRGMVRTPKLYDGAQTVGSVSLETDEDGEFKVRDIDFLNLFDQHAKTTHHSKDMIEKVRDEFINIHKLVKDAD